MNSDQVFAVALLVTLAVVVPVGLMILIPFARAWSKGVNGRLNPSAERGELDELRSRVQELEERLDFAERVLAQVREPEHITSGEHTAG